MTTAEEIKALILSFIEPSLLANKIAPAALLDDADLRAMGIMDSLAFVKLLGQLEGRLGTRIDLSELDPAQLTKIGALSRHIAASCSTT